MSSFPWDLIYSSWLVMVPVMLGLWLVQRVHRNAVIADVGFCLGFGFVIMSYAMAVPGEPVRQMLLATMGVTYGFRLGAHLLLNRVYGKTEDSRYQTLRTQCGRWAQLVLFLYFQGQALAIAVFSIPLLVLMINPSPLFTLWELVGMGVWLIAVTGEAVADSQLTRFRLNPANQGKTYREGLWRYSRHPN